MVVVLAPDLEARVLADAVDRELLSSGGALTHHGALAYPDASKRNLSEGNLIAHALDHLAAKRYDQAADILDIPKIEQSLVVY